MRHLPFAFALGVYGLYCGYTPWLLHARGEVSIAGIPYAASFAEAMLVYAIGLAVFVAAYAWLAQRRKIQVGKRVSKPSPDWATVAARAATPSALLLLWLAGLVAVLVGYRLSSVPLGAWVRINDAANHLNLFGKHFSTPLPDKAADALITVCLLLLCLPNRSWARRLVAPVLACTLGLFALAGFRYRILLLLGSALLYSGLQLRGARQVALAAVAGLALVLGMAWLTLNRMAVTQRRWALIDWNLTHFNPRLLANEANNSQTFMVLLAHRHAHGIGPDWGLSSIGFIGIRALPARLFADGQKPYPPLLAQIRDAYAATPGGALLHPAVSNMEEYYLGGGWLGLALGMAAMALLCERLGRAIAAQSKLLQILGCLGTLYLFQLISRGYLPQQVDLAVFLALPVALLYLYGRYGPTPGHRRPPGSAPTHHQTGRL